MAFSFHYFNTHWLLCFTLKLSYCEVWRTQMPTSLFYSIASSFLKHRPKGNLTQLFALKARPWAQTWKFQAMSLCNGLVFYHASPPYNHAVLQYIRTDASKRFQCLRWIQFISSWFLSKLSSTLKQMVSPLGLLVFPSLSGEKGLTDHIGLTTEKNLKERY